MSAKSTAAAAARKPSRPEKPYEGYPLLFHASGRIAKKVRGKLHYFGRWGHKCGDRIVPVDDVPAAAATAKLEFDRQWPYLKEGRTAPASGSEQQPEYCTMQDLCNAFWKSKKAAMLCNDLSPRSFRDYELTTDLLVAHFGKTQRVDDLAPEDFRALKLALSKRLSAVSLGNTINRIRCVFKYAVDCKLIKEKVNYGQEFNRPSAKAKRKEKKAGGKRMFEADELRTILDAIDGTPIDIDGKDEPVTRRPDPVLKAMVLLGLNCGFGNTDVSTLTQSALDLENGWIDFPRPKTAIDRRIPLWPETIAAIRAALDARPSSSAPDCDGLCFVTRNGEQFVRMQPQVKDPEKVQPIDVLSQKFAKLLKFLGINGRRSLGFYTLRHVFQTIGGESKDPDAVSAIMGHVDPTMAGQYREGISDQRLQDVVNTVRAWLWPATSQN